MRTLLKSTIGLVAVAILAAVIIGFVVLAKAPDMLSKELSKKMKVTVQIDDIDLTPGSIEVDNLVIDNVPKSILHKAFSSQKITISAPLLRYLDKHIVIDEITIDNDYLGLEFDSPSSKSGNWTQITNNMKSTASSEKSDRTVLIKTLVITNLDVDLVYKTGSDGAIKHLPRIDRMEFHNISSEGGLPMDQLMNSVLGQMLKEVFVKQNLYNMLDALQQSQKGTGIDQYIEPFKQLFK